MNSPIKQLSDDVNCPVVQVPGRKFPGVVLQGDSLDNILSLIQEARLNVSEDPEECNGCLDEAAELIEQYLGVYEASLKRHHLELPYRRLKK